MTSEYLDEILSQPETLRTGLKAWAHSLEDLPVLVPPAREGKNVAKFERVVMTGMGASLSGIYPAWLHLAQAGLPALWVEAAELLGMVGSGGASAGSTLLWIVSQSGRSAEIVALLESEVEAPLIGRDPFLLAITNDPESPLGKDSERAGRRLLLHAAPEKTASTRTYVNTLALAGLTARVLAGQDVEPALNDLERTADLLETYLSDWQGRLAELAAAVGAPGALALIGRGASLATAITGALELQEAAKYPALGMSAAQFRHGPFELADPSLTVLVYAGHGPERSLNARMVQDLAEKGAHPIWLDTRSGERPEPGSEYGLPIVLPPVPEIGLPIIEIATVQLLSLHLARINGFEPGVFRNIGKVTDRL